MAKISYAQRQKLPKSEFAIPSKSPDSGSYPIDTLARGRNALARVSQFGTSQEKATVRNKVRAKFPGITQGK